MSTPSTLILVGSPQIAAGEIERLRELAEKDARIIAWQHPAIVQERFPSPDVASSLTELGIHAVSLSDALGEALSVEVDESVIAWMKAFGRRSLANDGASFRGRFRYRGLTLWWWAELFLYHDTPLRLLVRDVEALARLLEKERPEQVILVGPVRELAAAANQLAKQVELIGKPTPARSRFRTTTLFLSVLFKSIGTGLKGLFRRTPRVHREGERHRFLFLSHASMWRERSSPETGERELVEMYFDEIPAALASAGEEVKLVAVGPPVPFRQRGLKDKLADVLEVDVERQPYVSIREYFRPSMSAEMIRASLDCWIQWHRFRRLGGARKALSHRGVPLGDGALVSFRDTFLLQLPWAIRAYHEVRTVLLEERPDVLVLYAESSGLGRAAVAAAHEIGVPTFAVQHGIMYPRYYSHEHAEHEVRSEADGADSVPIPTRTAVFGSLARDLLIQRGHYPPERIVITGSPKFDALVRSARGHDPEGTRARLGVEKDAAMLVVATRYSAIEPVFEELARAVEALPGLWMFVKPHQAESPEPYRQVVSRVGASRVQVLGAGENLMELLVASNGLITVDSLASSEALVLGRPVLVVNLPSNLGPLVERGVALGARRGDSIEQCLRLLLYDESVVSELEARRKEYIREFAFGADGGSTERIVEALRETAILRRNQA